jgi:hypothetical protein
MLYAICRYIYAFMRIWLKAALKPAPNCMRHYPTIVLYHHPQPYAVVQSHCEMAHSVRLVELYT